MGTTVPMPAWMRRIQQSFTWQIIMMPALVGFGGSLMLQGCLKDLANIDHACVMAAVNSTVLTFFTAWVKGHSVGSTQFASDGTTIPAAPALKELADAAVVVKAKAADPTSPTTTQDADEATRTVNAINNSVAMAATSIQVKAEAK